MQAAQPNGPVGEPTRPFRDMPADIQFEMMQAARESMNEVFTKRMLPVQLEVDKTMAKELQEQDDAAAAAELQTALSPTRGRRAPDTAVAELQTPWTRLPGTW
eukprot:5183382-Prymnesium_polylepis.1